MTAPVDPKRCALCGDDNNCGAARGDATCWCFSAQVPADVLERVAPSLRDVACVCERCVSGRRGAAEGPVVVDRVTRDR